MIVGESLIKRQKFWEVEIKLNYKVSLKAGLLCTDCKIAFTGKALWKKSSVVALRKKGAQIYGWLSWKTVEGWVGQIVFWLQFGSLREKRHPYFPYLLHATLMEVQFWALRRERTFLRHLILLINWSGKMAQLNSAPNYRHKWITVKSAIIISGRTFWRKWTHYRSLSTLLKSLTKKLSAT